MGRRNFGERLGLTIPCAFSTRTARLKPGRSSGRRPVWFVIFLSQRCVTHSPWSRPPPSPGADEGNLAVDRRSGEERRAFIQQAGPLSGSDLAYHPVPEGWPFPSCLSPKETQSLGNIRLSQSVFRSKLKCGSQGMRVGDGDRCGGWGSAGGRGYEHP